MTVATNYLGNILGPDEDARMALREIPVFNTASEELLDLIYRYGRVYALGEGEELTREGEFDQWVYFIVDGRLDVFVGEEKVDTIASSLVGERCILGEPRKATLRAGKGGTTALGVDMALLDALHDPAQPERDNFPVYLELLGRIVGELVQRLAEMEFYRMDVANKYATYLASDQDAEIVSRMRQSGYADDRAVTFAVYRYLSQHEPVLLAQARGQDFHRVDTRRLYALCLEQGRPELLFRIAGAVRATLNGNSHNAGRHPRAGSGDDGHPSDATTQGDPGKSAGKESNPEFSHLLNNVIRGLTTHHEGSSFDLRRLTAAGLQPYLMLNEDMEIDLRGLSAYLRDRFGYDDRALADVLMLVLQEASIYTARVNTHLKEMLKELSGISFLKDLRSAEKMSGIEADLFYNSTAPEDLIPFFSKNIIDVHLILPYLEKLGLTDPRVASADQAASDDHPEANPPAQGDESHTLVDSLFD